jgi:hypothetical protein
VKKHRTTREEVIKAIRKCYRKLGQVPTRGQLDAMAGVRLSAIYRNFETYTQAIQMSGLVPHPGRYRTEPETLLQDYGAVARKVGKLPSCSQYRTHGRWTVQPFKRLWRSWKELPEAFSAYVARTETRKEWTDVLQMIEIRRSEKARRRGEAANRQERICCALNAIVAPAPSITGKEMAESASVEGHPRRQSVPGRPVYGDPMLVPGMTREPVNEAGVIFVFGMLAHRLGFAVERIHAAFPDCEALRQIAPGRWQRLGIEFEYESRNFERHGHDAERCDVIVCWLHNWPECPPPLEIIELRRVMAGMG